jgi:hypothetical protein
MTVTTSSRGRPRSARQASSGRTRWHSPIRGSVLIGRSPVRRSTPRSRTLRRPPDDRTDRAAGGDGRGADGRCGPGSRPGALPRGGRGEVRGGAHEELRKVCRRDRVQGRHEPPELGSGTARKGTPLRHRISGSQPVFTPETGVEGGDSPTGLLGCNPIQPRTSDTSELPGDERASEKGHLRSVQPTWSVGGSRRPRKSEICELPGGDQPSERGHSRSVQSTGELRPVRRGAARDAARGAESRVAIESHFPSFHLGGWS